MKKILRIPIFYILFLSSSLQAQAPPTPEQVLNFKIGEDYKLADYGQISDYFQLLSQSSDRVLLEELGYTTEGNKLFMAHISSPVNLSKLEYFKNIQSQLADPRKITEHIAADLIEKGKTIVSINCSIHSTEIGASQMAIELAYELAASESPDTQEILNNVILLLLPVHNPDGLNMVVDWYSRYLGTKYEGCKLPWLYHKYTGHDINRDWYMLTQQETRLTVEKIFNIWHPQIVLDMHQMGSKAARLFLPPYTDPIDPNIDPILVSEISMLGQTMVAELTAEGKAGVITNVIFDAWSPSRTYIHYHGGIRILSETAGCNIASPIKVDLTKQNRNRSYDLTTSSWNYTLPWFKGDWHLKNIVEYEKSVVRALLTNAAKYRTMWLRNFYIVGKNAISSKSKPYAYVIPANQWDKSMLFELLQVLWRGQVEIHQAKNKFYASGEEFQVESYVILMNQPYSAFARTLLELQKYPQELHGNSYDISGHTISYVMGVTVVPVEHSFNADLTLLDDISLAPGKVQQQTDDSQYVVFSHKMNYSVKAINYLLSKEYKLYWLHDSVSTNNNQLDIGTIVVKSVTNNPELSVLAQEYGINFKPLSQNLLPLSVDEIKQPQIGLYKSWVPSKDEGWIRFVMEEYEFKYESLTDSIIQKRNLGKHFDVIILPSLTAVAIKNGHSSTKMPPKYCGGIGKKGINNLKRFVRKGGTLIAIDFAAIFVIEEFQLPVKIVTLQRSSNFWAPGPVLRINIKNTHPIGFGLPAEAAINFSKSPILETTKGNKIAWFPAQKLLISGALTGENFLTHKPLVVEFNYEKGRIILFAFRPMFRAQTRGVYKLMFNSIFSAKANVDRLF